MSVIGDGPNPGLTQFAISVEEVPKTTRFYCDVLGCLPAGGLLVWVHLIGFCKNYSFTLEDNRVKFFKLVW